MISLLDAALDYAARGWRVLPVHGITESGGCTCNPTACVKRKPGKHPAIENWVQNASTDPELIKVTWTRHPEWNIGIATGEETGFWVLDIDVKGGGFESLDQLELQHGKLPETRTAITGSGGRHFLFTSVPGMGNRAKLSPGIDVRANGGQIVAAPSRHASGDVYRWVNEDVPVAPAPGWLVQLIIEHLISSNGNAQGNGDEYWANVWLNGADEGARNDAVARLIGYLLRKGHHAGMVLDMVQLWNKAHVRPPLPDREIEATFVSIATKDTARLRGKRT